MENAATENMVTRSQVSYSHEFIKPSTENTAAWLGSTTPWMTPSSFAQDASPRYRAGRPVKRMWQPPVSPPSGASRSAEYGSGRSERFATHMSDPRARTSTSGLEASATNLPSKPGSARISPNAR